MCSVFVGLDLAWQGDRNPTGAAVLSGDETGVDLECVADPLRSFGEITSFVSRHLAESVVIAIDAPLVIVNSTGQRECEREVSARYGERHASCHSSNLSLYPHASSVQLAQWLASNGFTHAPSEVAPHTMLEVYPHAAFVALFDLPTIIRYKKGRVADRCAGLRIVQQKLRALAGESAPLRDGAALRAFIGRDPAVLRGSRRKEYEDSLDAIFCAYLAYYFWRWGRDRSEVFGDVDSGYIVNPRLQARRVDVVAA